MSTIEIEAIHGLLMAAYVCTLTLGALELFGVDKVNFVSGNLQFCTAIGAFAAPPVVSYLHEAFGNNIMYTLIIISGIYCMGLASSLTCWTIYRLKKRGA